MKNSNFTILSLKFHKLPLKHDEILTQDKTLFGIPEAWFLCLVPFAFYEQESNRCPTVAVKCRHGDRCKCNHKTIGKKDLKIFSGFERDSVEPTSFAIPVQCSPKWAIKATWERSCVGWPFIPAVLWLHSHLSLYLQLIATVGHLLLWNLHTWAEYYVHWT